MEGPKLFTESHFSDSHFTRYMESVFSYVATNEKLDPSEGIELSGEGVILEVEKLQSEEMKEITKKIKEAQKLVEAVEKEDNIDDDDSEDWLPSKGDRKCEIFVSLCATCTIKFLLIVHSQANSRAHQRQLERAKE